LPFRATPQSLGASGIPEVGTIRCRVEELAGMGNADQFVDQLAGELHTVTDNVTKIAASDNELPPGTGITRSLSMTP
jgi:hypothetical protein